jgi:hypothetical protein
VNGCVQGRVGWSPQSNDHVVYYESWKLKENEKNYATHDLELASIVVWRIYLEELPHGEDIWVKNKLLWSEAFIWTTNIKWQKN